MKILVIEIRKPQKKGFIKPEVFEMDSKHLEYSRRAPVGGPM